MIYCLSLLFASYIPAEAVGAFWTGSPRLMAAQSFTSGAMLMGKRRKSLVTTCGE